MNKYTEMKLIRLQNNQFDILLYNSQKKREWGRGGQKEDRGVCIENLETKVPDSEIQTFKSINQCRWEC